MTTTTDPVELKREGQARSQTSLTGQQVHDFMMTVVLRPVGLEVSANDVRARLDHLGIPEKSRAGLFARAVAAGLLEKVTWALPDGSQVPKRIPSTGTSAHSATVLVYRRTSTRYLGAPTDSP